MKGIYLIINHTFDFTEDEIIGIKSQMKALAFYDICLVTSKQNVLEGFHKQFSNYYCGTNEIRIEYFDEAYFESIQGYNKLLCSIEFYERFTNYDYIIVSQPDVFLTNPQKFPLLNSLMQKYDYVGAPWFQNIYEVPSLMLLKPKSLYTNSYYRYKFRILHKLFQKGLLTRPLFLDIKYFSGNGGFSVRNVHSCLNYLKKISDINKKQIEEIYASANTSIDTNIFSEDIFWSLISKKVNKNFKIAPASMAVKIAWETGEYNELFYYSKNELPIAIHAWMKLGLKNFIRENFICNESFI